MQRMETNQSVQKRLRMQRLQKMPRLQTFFYTKCKKVKKIKT